MAKMIGQYKGTKATGIALPKLTMGAMDRSAVSTAVAGYQGTLDSISKMQKFLEEKAAKEAVQSGFEYSLMNQPSAEEINGMIEKREQKLPFNPNSMNIAELTANEYISAEIRGQAENKTKQRLHKLFNEDFYNANDGKGMTLAEADEAAKNIIDNYASMFVNNKSTYDTFMSNMKVYGNAQANRNLNTRLQLDREQRTNVFTEDLNIANEAADKIYDVAGMQGVVNHYNNLIDRADKTMGADSEKIIQQIKNARDKALQKLTSDQMKKYFTDVPDLNNPNQAKIQTLVNDINMVYINEPEKGLAILTEGIIAASEGEAGFLKLQVLENMTYGNKKITDYEEWNDLERSAISQINTLNTNYLENTAKMDIVTIGFAKDEILKNLDTNPELQTRSGIEQYINNFLQRNELKLSDGKIEIAIDDIEKSITTEIPDKTVESISDIKKMLREESISTQQSIIEVGQKYLEENILSSKDEKELTNFIVAYTDVSKDADYKPFRDRLKSRLKITNIFGVETEEQLTAYQGSENFYISHVLTQDLGYIQNFMSRENISLRNDEFAKIVITNFTPILEKALEKRIQATGNQDLTLSDIRFESLDNNTKDKITTAMSFHGQFLHLSGYVADDFFKMYFSAESQQERADRLIAGQQFFDILDSQTNELFQTRQRVKEGQTVEVPDE
jgi:hypothetical protein